MSEQITKQAAPWGQILVKAVAAARTGGQAAGKGLGRYAQLMAGGDKAVLAKPNQMREAILGLLGKQRNLEVKRYYGKGPRIGFTPIPRTAGVVNGESKLDLLIDRLGKRVAKMRQRLTPLDVAANREKELVGLARRTTANAATVAGAGTLGMAIGSRGETKEAEAYLEGFRKMAEAWGVDPQELLQKEAQLSRIVGGVKALLGRARKAQRLGKGFSFMPKSKFRGDGSYIYASSDATPGATRVIDKGNQVWYRNSDNNVDLGKRFGVQASPFHNDVTTVGGADATGLGLDYGAREAIRDFARNGKLPTGNSLTEQLLRRGLGSPSSVTSAPGISPSSTWLQRLLSRIQTNGTIK